ncbi:MAG: YvrJ family protein [Candidatus Thorarchaeota archaeon]
MDIVKLFAELGFPIAVAVYLLVFQGRKIDKLVSALIEVQIGNRIILSKLEATKEYDEAVGEFRKREENRI